MNGPHPKLSAATVPAPAHYAATPGSWYALAILTLIYSCHFLDRSVVALVAEPLRLEFGLSDGQLGTLTGLVFGLTFALAGVPIGLLVDRLNRRRLLASVVFLWSAATALGGLAQSYWALLAARMAVGAAESGGAPTSMSLISDHFPPRQRATAMGVYYLGNAIGGLMCIVVGGYVAKHHGWRAAFFVAGIPGMALALLAWFTLREPARGGRDPAPAQQQAPTALLPALRQIGAHPVLPWLYAAIALTSAAAAALGAWVPPFLMRSHGLDVGSASLVLAVGGGGFGALGSLGGGSLADRLGRERPSRRTGFAAVSLLAAIPVALVATLTHATPLGIAMLCTSFLLLFAAIPVAFGSMLSLAAPRLRGISSAAMQVVSNLVGYGLGPFGVGVLSDALGAGHLGLAMACVIAACCLGAAGAFVMASRRIASTAGG